MQGRYDISTLTCSFFAAPSHRRRLLFRLLRFSSSDELVPLPSLLLELESPASLALSRLSPPELDGEAFRRFRRLRCFRRAGAA
jgi:hypothetical protein